jgi:peptidyl-prolyl cis-trans isomerase C
MSHRAFLFAFVILIVLLSIQACVPGLTSLESATPGVVVTPSNLPPTPTPSATPEPLALRVNGLGVTMREFEAERQRLQAAAVAAGQTLDAETERERLLQEFIEQLLLAQAAYASGYQDDATALEQKIVALQQQLGGVDAWQKWLQENFYTEDTYRLALARAQAAAWQQAQIIEAVPQVTEQIHARQILVRDRDVAEQYYRQLQGGADFETLAFQVDPLTGGDLGWFPRGYLTQPALEDAVFALQPGQYTNILESPLGYHILYVVSRDAARPLAPEARRTLQHQALQRWLQDQRERAVIEVFLP